MCGNKWYDYFELLFWKFYVIVPVSFSIERQSYLIVETVHLVFIFCTMFSQTVIIFLLMNNNNNNNKANVMRISVLIAV